MDNLYRPYTLSPQNFVRALKAPTDPPQPDAPLKIEIAKHAWSDTHFYVPNKDELVVDWILTRLLKDKSKDLESNSILDVRFWALLADVITHSEHPVPSTRPVKTWLVSLLNRIPIAPVVMSFFNFLPDLDHTRLHSLSLAVHRCLAVIWPLGSHKATPEVLLDSFGAVIGVLSQGNINEDLARIYFIIASSFRIALGNTPNKKKLCSLLTQNHLQNWLVCTNRLESSNLDSTFGALFDDIYATGVETLFSLDVLRQGLAQDQTLEGTLFEALSKIEPISLVLPVLPRLLTSTIQFLRRYRTSLFGKGSNHVPGASMDEMRKAGMMYFISCARLLDNAGDCEDAWVVRLQLLSIVDTEKLFTSSQLEAADLLKENGELAIAALASGWPGYQLERTKLAIDVFSALIGIDFDLVSPAIPRVLSKLTLVNEACNNAALILLELLLDFHSKTRTLNSYIPSILDTLTSFHLTPFPDGSRTVYQVSLSGPLLCLTHLDKLSKCVHSFLTPGQTLETVRTILQHLNDIWERFYGSKLHSSADSGKGVRKKRRVEGRTEGNVDPELVAIMFSLSARFASAVLSSLPVQSLTDNLSKEVGELLEDTQKAFVQTILSKCLKMVRNADDHSDIWAPQVVAAAALRFVYVLRGTSSLHQRCQPDKNLSIKMLDIVVNDGALPELVLEIYRTLLAQLGSSEPVEPQMVLDSLLGYIDRYAGGADVGWHGLSCRLTLCDTGKQESVIALIYLLVDRWLPVVDLLASEQQLQQLAQLLMHIEVKGDPYTSLANNAIRSDLILTYLLRSALFWELPNLRTAILSSAGTDTDVFDTFDLTEGFSLTASVPSSTVQGLQRASATYQKLLFFPIEYLSRSSRANLTRRALIADVVFNAMLKDQSAPEVYISSSIVIMRTFLKRIFQHFGFVDHAHIHEFLEHMLDPLHTAVGQSKEYTSITLDLIEMHLTALLRKSQEASFAGLSAMISYFSPALLEQLFEHETQTSKILRRSLIIFLDLITKYSLTTLPEQIQSSMKSLFVALHLTLHPSMLVIAAEGPIDRMLGHEELLAAWCRLLALQKWLLLQSPSLPRFGSRLVSRSLSSARHSVPESGADPRLKIICVAAFAIVLEEVHGSPEGDRLAQLDVAVAAYISALRFLDANGQLELDLLMSRTCKLLPVSDHSQALDLLSCSLASQCYPSEDMTYFIRLSSIMLREAPPGTLKLVQTFTTECLNVFVKYPAFSSGPSALRVQTLDFVATHVSERPAAIRSVDLSSIWSLLSKFLTGSPHHDEHTSTTTLHEIVTIATSVIRLRRDLVMDTLPHLGMILQQLIMSIRSLRPQLGARQSKLVTDTLPLWVNANQPLASEEARALARLLTSLVTKTISRTHQSFSETQKAESLAKPFSKHAAYVLKAYIDVVNNPFCVLPLVLRKELRPGIFALCDMLSEHSRDALVVSALDAGGKATLKALWKEYEKQRYVGKG